MLSKDKISIRQVMLLFLSATLSPAIRLFPHNTSKTAGRAGWLAPVAAVIPLIIIIFIVNSFYKQGKIKSLADVYTDILGNLAGKIVVVFYHLWILFLDALYVRYYAERLLSTTMSKTSNIFLISIMLILVFYATRKGLKTIAIANDVFFNIFLVIFSFVFITAIPMIKYNNVMSVSYLDIWPVMKSSTTIFGVWGYYLFFFFLGNKIKDTQNLVKTSLQGIGIKFVLTILGLIMTIGSFGSLMISHNPIPFFAVVRNISLFGVIERIESIIISVWVITDFILIAFFTYTAAVIMKTLFNLSSEKSVLTPIILFAGTGGVFMFKNRLELANFSDKFALPANILLTIIVPIIVFAIGKLRKKI